MRLSLISLLVLLPLSASASPVLEVQIETPATTCVHRTNRARVITNATAGATYVWTISNGTIIAGKGTQSIEYTSAEIGTTVIMVNVDCFGLSATDHKSVTVFALPSISRQPKSAVVAPGASATLSIAVSDDAIFYDWYEGVTGDASKLVLAGATEFTTPPLRKSTSYWVRVSNGCSSASSQTATVTVAAKRRATGH